MTSQISLEKATQEILNRSEWLIKLDAADLSSIVGNDKTNVKAIELSTTDSTENRFKDLFASIQTQLEAYDSSIGKRIKVLYFFQYPLSNPMTRTELDTINYLIDNSLCSISDYEVIWGVASREDGHARIICIFNYETLKTEI